MYDTDIQTTVSIRGHIIFIEYRVTPEWAVEWWVNDPAYNYDDPATDSAICLLDTLLRTFEPNRIEQTLLTEFESRQYAAEQAYTAELEKEDIPF